MNKYTSLKLSKLLTDNGFEGESEYSYKRYYVNGGGKLSEPKFCNDNTGEYPAYDILNDLCVKYAEEMFGNKMKRAGCRRCLVYIGYDMTNIIISLLQQNKKDEAEEYIWEYCLFNKNKL